MVPSLPGVAESGPSQQQPECTASGRDPASRPPSVRATLADGPDQTIPVQARNRPESDALKGSDAPIRGVESEAFHGSEIANSTRRERHWSMVETLAPIVARGDLNQLQKELDNPDAKVTSNLLFEAMLEAISSSKVEVLSMLLNHPKANPTFQQSEVMVHAARGGHAACLAILLQDGRANPGTQDNEPLVRAAAAGCVQSVDLLLSLGGERVDPSAQNCKAFWRAACAGAEEVVDRLMLDPRVDPAALSSMALRLAANRGHSNIVIKLAQVSDPSTRDQQALRDACTKGHIHVVDILLEDPRVDPSALDHAALKNTIARGHVAILKLLLLHLPRNLGDAGNEAIRMAIRQKRYGIVALLVAHTKADVSQFEELRDPIFKARMVASTACSIL